MIILDSTLKSLEVKLAGAVATTQLPYVAGYVSLSTDALTFVSAESDGTTNGATAVTVVSAPAASAQQQLKFLSVYNVDTASATVTVQLNNNGTKRVIFTATLAVGYTLQYTDGEGFRVLNTVGAVLSTSTAAGTAMLSVSVALTDAQIKALPTTPITVIASPGSGFRLRVLQADISINNTAADYTNLDAAYVSLQLQYATSGAWAVLPMWDDSTMALTQVTAFLAGTNGRKYCDWQTPYVDGRDGGAVPATVTYVATLDPNVVGNIENLALQLAADNNGTGNFTGGNASNTALVNVYYVVETLAP